MTAINDTLLIVHFIGLMLGAGGGFGSTIAMRHALALPPEQAGVIRGLGPTLAHMSLLGLILLWVTGLALVFNKYGGFDLMPVMFWVKIGFVLLLTFAAIAIEMTYAQVKKGNAQAAARLPKLGPVAGISSLLAVVFATLAFH